MFVYTKFWGNMSRDSDFKSQKLPRKFGVKTGLIKKRVKYGKKIVHMVIMILFHSYQSTFAAMSFFFLPNSRTLYP